MKRTPLKRRTGLKRSTPARSGLRLVQPLQEAESARCAWKTPRWGRCENCGWIAVVPLHGHHVVARQVLARMGADQFDERDRMDLCPQCHLNHEFGQTNRQIPLSKVPERAKAFAVEVLGEDGAKAYLERHYSLEDV